MQDPKEQAYFEKLCNVLPILRELKAEQDALGDNYFGLFIHFLTKFSQLPNDLNLQQNPELRYELLFNIVEMGNLIDAMRLLERAKELEKQDPPVPYAKQVRMFFENIKRFRNVVADGYHAYSTQSSADIIPVVRDFFKFVNTNPSNRRFNNSLYGFKNKMHEFKDRFKKINGDNDNGDNNNQDKKNKAVYAYITEGGPEQEKIKIEILFRGIKYFLDKSTELLEKDQYDCAMLYFISAGNAARDFECYFAEKTRLEKRPDVETLKPSEAAKLYKEQNHIWHLLINLGNLRFDRSHAFAHTYAEGKETAKATMHKKISKATEFSEDIARLYKSMDIFLARTYQAPKNSISRSRITHMADDSPRAYNPHGLWAPPRPEVATRRNLLNAFTETQDHDLPRSRQRQDDAPRSRLQRRDDSPRRRVPQRQDDALYRTDDSPRRRIHQRHDDALHRAPPQRQGIKREREQEHRETERQEVRQQGRSLLKKNRE